MRGLSTVSARIGANQSPKRRGFATNSKRGDERRAEKLYEFGFCLAQADVTLTVVFALQRRSHLAITQLMVVPISQN